MYFNNTRTLHLLFWYQNFFTPTPTPPTPPRPPTQNLAQPLVQLLPGITVVQDKRVNKGYYGLWKWCVLFSLPSPSSPSSDPLFLHWLLHVLSVLKSHVDWFSFVFFQISFCWDFYICDYYLYLSIKKIVNRSFHRFLKVFSFSNAPKNSQNGKQNFCLQSLYNFFS